MRRVSSLFFDYHVKTLSDWYVTMVQRWQMDAVRSLREIADELAALNDNLDALNENLDDESTET